MTSCKDMTYYTLPVSHLSIMFFSREKKQDGKTVVVKDAIYMHAVHLQQTRGEYISLRLLPRRHLHP